MGDRTSPAARNIYYEFTADRSSKLVRRPRGQAPSRNALSHPSKELWRFRWRHSHCSAPLTASWRGLQYVPNTLNATSVSPYDHRSFLRTTVTRLVRLRAAAAPRAHARAHSLRLIFVRPSHGRTRRPACCRRSRRGLRGAPAAACAPYGGTTGAPRASFQAASAELTSGLVVVAAARRVPGRSAALACRLCSARMAPAWR